MPKKEGIVKTYSFYNETIKQLEFLSKHFMLKPTNVIEFVVNQKYKEIVENAKKTDRES